jgi:tetratricopeptide (TPR) repeat protein
VLALAGGIVALSLGGNDGQRSASKPPAKKQPARKRVAKNPAPQAAPQQPQSTPVGASGAQLNDQGFALMRQGRYAEAIPLLEQAVKSFPAGSQSTSYAYALYNLGSSLRRAGRAGEAVPVLERRLQIPNQTDVVRRELELARRDAAR